MPHFPYQFFIRRISRLALFLLAIVNNGAMDVLAIQVFVVYRAKVYGRMNHMVLLFLFKGKTVLVLVVAVLVYIRTSTV